MFAELRERGERVRSGWLWCSMVIDDTSEAAHVGYAIGRKVGNAVERNRLRRRIRAALGQHEAQLPAGRYLIGVSPRPTQPSWHEVQQAVDRLLRALSSRAAGV